MQNYIKILQKQILLSGILAGIFIPAFTNHNGPMNLNSDLPTSNISFKQNKNWLNKNLAADNEVYNHLLDYQKNTWVLTKDKTAIDIKTKLFFNNEEFNLTGELANATILAMNVFKNQVYLAIYANIDTKDGIYIYSVNTKKNKLEIADFKKVEAVSLGTMSDIRQCSINFDGQTFYLSYSEGSPIKSMDDTVTGNIYQASFDHMNLKEFEKITPEDATTNPISLVGGIKYFYTSPENLGDGAYVIGTEKNVYLVNPMNHKAYSLEFNGMSMTNTTTVAAIVTSSGSSGTTLYITQGTKIFKASHIFSPSSESIVVSELSAESTNLPMTSEFSSIFSNLHNDLFITSGNQLFELPSGKNEKLFTNVVKFESQKTSDIDSINDINADISGNIVVNVVAKNVSLSGLYTTFVPPSKNNVLAIVLGSVFGVIGAGTIAFLITYVYLDKRNKKIAESNLKNNTNIESKK